MINMSSNESLKNRYEEASSGVRISFNAYFPQHKIDLLKRTVTYFEEEKLVRLRSGLAVGIYSGQLRVGKVNYRELSEKFRGYLHTEIFSLNFMYSIPTKEAEKIAIATYDQNMSWDEGLALLKNVYGASGEHVHEMSFEDALFTIFLRIEHSPEDISFLSKIFRSSKKKEQLRGELQKDKRLFDTYIEHAIKCCEDRMGCSDADLEKIYSECIAYRKKGEKQD